MKLDQALLLIRDIPDFPSPGILFKDITPLLANGEALSAVTAELSLTAEPYSHVVGIEARGFILGAAIAAQNKRGFVPIRKAGKLPYATISRSYGLEYGTDVIEAHVDALAAGDSVLVIDDVLATGGTLLATLQLIEELGASVAEVVVLFEIRSLKGREKILTHYPHIRIRTLVAS